MMQILILPPEILSMVLNEAVQARNLKRALRLRLVASMYYPLHRYVSLVVDRGLGSFNEGLIEALCRSNMIEKYCRDMSALNWPWLRPYFERRLLEKRTKGLPTLHTIRTITERLVANSESALTYEDLAIQLLELSANSRLRGLFAKSIPLDTNCFSKSLLVAATFANDVSLVRELASTVTQPTLDTTFGGPFEAALEAGNYDNMSVLHATQGITHGLHAVVRHGDIAVLQLMLQQKNHPVTLWLDKEQQQQRQVGKRSLRSFLGTPSVQVFETMVLELSSRRLATLNAEVLSDLLRGAAGSGWADMFNHLVKRGAQVDEMSRLSRTYPLSWACKAVHHEIVQLLLDNGAILRDSEIRQAARFGHTATVRVLLESQDVIDVRFTTGCLYAAARKGFADIVSLLLDFGIDPNEGKPAPLVGAVGAEHAGIVRMLIERGANVTPILRSARKRAKAAGLDSMLELLDELEQDALCDTSDTTTMST